MRTVRIAELKDRLSEYLRAVEGGAEVVVTHRNRPIARIVPLDEVGGRIRVLPASRSFRSIRGRRFKAAGWAIASTDLLLEERGER